MILNRTCLLIGVSLLLAGCLDQRAPSGYVSVSSTGNASSTSQCPDLVGSFDLSNVPLGRAITDQIPPETRGLPVLMTFKQGPTHLEAWWVVPIHSLREWSDKEREKNPVNYARWRNLVMQRPGPMARAQDIASLRNETSKFGPQAGPFFAGIVSYQCAQNWMRIREQPGYRGTPNNPDAEGFGETEIWLGRDAQGAMLVKTIYYNLKSFHVWGDASSSIRTSSSATWSKVAASEFVDAVPLEEGDLPSSLPKDAFRSCGERINQLAALTNKISASAPDGVFLIGSEVPAYDPAQSREDCAGKGKVIELVFSSRNPDQLQRLEEQILGEPDVQGVRRLSKAEDAPSMRRFSITLR